MIFFLVRYVCITSMLSFSFQKAYPPTAYLLDIKHVAFKYQIGKDSRGKTSFWNSRNGTLLDSYQSHKGDILTVTCNQDQTVIYASGADPTIVHFQSVVTGENKVSFDSDCFLVGIGAKIKIKIFLESIHFSLCKTVYIIMAKL